MIIAHFNRTADGLVVIVIQDRKDPEGIFLIVKEALQQRATKIVDGTTKHRFRKVRAIQVYFIGKHLVPIDILRYAAEAIKTSAEKRGLSLKISQPTVYSLKIRVMG